MVRYLGGSRAFLDLVRPDVGGAAAPRSLTSKGTAGSRAVRSRERVLEGASGCWPATATQQPAGQP